MAGPVAGPAAGGHGRPWGPSGMLSHPAAPGPSGPGHDLAGGRGGGPLLQARSCRGVRMLSMPPGRALGCSPVPRFSVDAGSRRG